MTIGNAYRELPVVAYKRTSVEEKEVIAYLQLLRVPLEIKRSAFVIFSIESARGQKGVNNNYAGIQADGRRIGGEFDKRVTGTCVVKENGTGNERRFVAFSSFKDSIDYLVNRVQSRGMYIGGFAKPYSNMTVMDVDTLSRAYWKEWVTGSSTAEPAPAQKSNFKALYAIAFQVL
jgi:hypothetical protein